MSKDYSAVLCSKDEWITPKYITNALGEFDLDPCAPHPDLAPWAHAKKSFYLPDHNGLAEPWEGRVWLNPPYLNQAAWPWLRKLHSHKSGIALINATTDTDGFQQWAFEFSHSVFFFRQRLKFYHVDGKIGKNGPMVGSALVSFSPADSMIIRASKLSGNQLGYFYS